MSGTTAQNWNYRTLPPKDRALLDGFGGEQGVFVRPSLVRLCKGRGSTAIFLAQLLYWARRTHDPEGWVSFTQAQFEEQTGLGFAAQNAARKNLEELGLLEAARRGLPARLYLRLDLARLVELVVTNEEQRAARRQELDSRHGQEPVLRHAEELESQESRELIKETNLEISLENSTSSSGETASRTLKMPIQQPGEEGGGHNYDHDEPRDEEDELKRVEDEATAAVLLAETKARAARKAAALAKADKRRKGARVANELLASFPGLVELRGKLGDDPDRWFGWMAQLGELREKMGRETFHTALEAGLESLALPRKKPIDEPALYLMAALRRVRPKAPPEQARAVFFDPLSGQYAEVAP